MISVAKKTKLSPRDALLKAIDYFTRQGLEVVDTTAELTGSKGGVVVSVSGSTVTTKQEYKGVDVAAETEKYLTQHYGFDSCAYTAHLHTTPDPSVGHVVVTINRDDKTEITVESREMDEAAKQFLTTIPG